DDPVRLPGRFEGTVRKRRPLRLERLEADLDVGVAEAEPRDFGERVEHAAGRGGDLGTDTVALHHGEMDGVALHATSGRQGWTMFEGMSVRRSGLDRGEKFADGLVEGLRLLRARKMRGGAQHDEAGTRDLALDLRM